jgi:hypothetical protein
MHAALLALVLLSQRSGSFTLSLDAPAADALPLFGPIREAEWSPGWAPRFVHPPEGAQRDGVVFTTTTGSAARLQLWVLTEYDLAAGRVAYVVTEPGFLVTEIKVQVVPDGARCRATVTYRRSALDPAANHVVDALDAHWTAAQGPHWEAAINAALARGRHRPPASGGAPAPADASRDWAEIR